MHLDGDVVHSIREMPGRVRGTADIDAGELNDHRVAIRMKPVA